MDMKIESNAKKVNDVFKELSMDIQDMQPMFKDALMYWRYGFPTMGNAYTKPLGSLIFETNGQQAQDKWADLSPLYKQIRNNKPILVQSGRLKKAANMQSSDSVVVVGKKSLKMGVQNIPYARLQHWGHSQMPTEKQKYFFRGMIGKSGGAGMWKGLYKKAVRKEPITYKPRAFMLTPDKQIPIRFIGFFSAWYKDRIGEIEKQIKNLPTGGL
jgi:phage gpG-like protein